MYDITDKSSFDKIEFYIEDIVETEKIKLVYLIGNKVDLVEGRIKEREVSEEEAKIYAEENNFRFFELSVKDLDPYFFLNDLSNEIVKIKKDNYQKKN